MASVQQARSRWVQKLGRYCQIRGRLYDLMYYPRPVLEDLAKVREAAKAGGVPMGQIAVMPRATFCFDHESEVPIRFQPRLAPPPVFVRGWWTTSKAVHHEHLERYNIYQVMQDIYDHVKLEQGDEAAELPEWFLDCRAGNAMLETFRMLGSLAHYEMGTCFFKSTTSRAGVGGEVEKAPEEAGRRGGGTAGGKPFVVVDGAIDTKLLMDEVLEHMDLVPVSPKRPLRQTFCSIVTVPRAVYDADKDRIMQRELSALVSDHDAGAKVAVEIDRRQMGLGNIILFAPPTVAHDTDAVWEMLERLDTEVLGCSLLALRLFSRVQGVQGLPYVYTLVPDVVKEADIRYEWACDV